MTPTPALLGRRILPLLASALGTTAATAPTTAAAQRAGQGEAAPFATPSQITGPFYPTDWAGDADADLVRVTGAAAAAQGIVTHLRGRILDLRGSPISGATIEIWQCDSNGLYRHPNDRPGVRDAGFQGHGRIVTRADGGFAFRTIKPVPYPGRPPHIHVLVALPSRPTPLITQLYVAGEPANDADRLYQRIGTARAREAVLLHLQPAERIEAGAILAVRDIVLG